MKNPEMANLPRIPRFPDGVGSDSPNGVCVFQFLRLLHFNFSEFGMFLVQFIRFPVFIRSTFLVYEMLSFSFLKMLSDLVFGVLRFSIFDFLSR